MKYWCTVCIVNCGIKNVKTQRSYCTVTDNVYCVHIQTLYIDLHPIFHPGFIKVLLSVDTRCRCVGGFIEAGDKTAGVHVVVVVCSDLGRVWATAFVQLSEGSSQ